MLPPMLVCLERDTRVFSMTEHSNLDWHSESGRCIQQSKGHAELNCMAQLHESHGRGRVGMAAIEGPCGGITIGHD